MCWIAVHARPCFSVGPRVGTDRDQNNTSRLNSCELHVFRPNWTFTTDRVRQRPRFKCDPEAGIGLLRSGRLDAMATAGFVQAENPENPWKDPVQEYVPSFLRSEQHLADVSGSSIWTNLDDTLLNGELDSLDWPWFGTSGDSSPAPALQPALRSTRVNQFP